MFGPYQKFKIMKLVYIKRETETKIGNTPKNGEIDKLRVTLYQEVLLGLPSDYASINIEKHYYGEVKKL